MERETRLAQICPSKSSHGRPPSDAHEIVCRRPRTTYFKFSASHDGIGVRLLEEFVLPHRWASLLTAGQTRDGRIAVSEIPTVPIHLPN